MALYLPPRHGCIEPLENLIRQQEMHSNKRIKPDNPTTKVCFTVHTSELPDSQDTPSADKSAFEDLSLNMEPSYQPFLASKDKALLRRCCIPSSKIRSSIRHNLVKRLNASTERVFPYDDVCDGHTFHTPGLRLNSSSGPVEMKSVHDLEKAVSFGCAMLYGRAIHSPCLQLDGLRYEHNRIKTDLKLDQGGMLTDRQCRSSPGCTVALPEGVLLEPGFIHRRNERERDRVRSLNQGYHMLKQRLPLTNKDKRISKVDTLRIAIRYIRQLRSILGQTDIAQPTDVAESVEEPPGDADSSNESSYSTDFGTKFDEMDGDNRCIKDGYEDEDARDIVQRDL
ncbi:achaete-scute 4 [Elysia marginata]|uniref:Achaete-scute 4 n=1 Tax=Elysia marginata TaxID=1093978 RepID=A0AAV4IFR7_9GAST|nr:achaete-scute 4 [Elysia marginata]